DPDLFELARKQDWGLDPDRIECPVRLVWGTEDRILPLPEAAVRFREEWVPQAEWIELNGVGHAPQLDVPDEAVRQILEVTGGAAASRR
ncbi:MAG: alpha/beta hydrolase, partial [Solirubrobacterales bacterium]|nr:alpha/beta hydrolase [Solirubrobacterales bacterium]